MKHLVFLTGKFYPDKTPTSRCANDLIKILKRDFNVTVVCPGKFLPMSSIQHDGLDIHFISNWRNSLFAYANVGLKDNQNLSKLYYNTIVTIVRIIGLFLSYILKPTREKWMIKKYVEKMNNINIHSHIDIVFSVSFPIETHVAASYYKKLNPDIKWISYTIDAFYNKQKDKEYNRILEKKLLKECDKSFVTEEIYEQCQDVFSEAVALPYMLSSLTSEKTIFFDVSKINLLFAGRFYKEIRNPEYLFKTILELSDNNIVLHLFATSDCDLLINKYVKKAKGKILYHKLVSMDRIHVLMNSADFLVNVGNSLPEFKPSKTFEYIATGKPIINFYQKGGDDQILARYPLALQVNQELSEADNAVNIFHFVNKSLKKTIPFIELKKIYINNSSEHIKSVLQNSLT